MNKNPEEINWYEILKEELELDKKCTLTKEFLCRDLKVESLGKQSSIFLKCYLDCLEEIKGSDVRDKIIEALHKAAKEIQPEFFQEN